MDRNLSDIDMDTLDNRRAVDGRGGHRLLFTFEDTNTLVVDHEDGNGDLVESFTVKLDAKA